MRFSTGNKCAFSAAVAAVIVSHLFCEDGIERARALDCRKARRIMVETAWELHEGFRTKWGPKSRALRLAPTYKLCRIYAHRYPDRVSTRH